MMFTKLKYKAACPGCGIGTYEADSESGRCRSCEGQTLPLPPDFVHVVFDGPPSRESGRFVEVEDETGKSISFGDWIDRGDGLWSLRFTDPRPLQLAIMGMAEERDKYRAMLEECASVLDEDYDGQAGLLTTTRINELLDNG